MPQLLLELFSEEIPARMQKRAACALKENIVNKLIEAKISFAEALEFYTPRRIAIVIEGLPLKQEDIVIEKRGPRIDSPEAAINGFLQANNISQQDLVEQETDKGKFYFAYIKLSGKNTADILNEIISAELNKFTWPKSMKWNNYQIKWVRPLHNILCVFNEDVVPVKFGHIQANNYSFGHRFMSKQKLVIANFKDYQKKLYDNFVVLDADERKDIILNDSNSIAKQAGLSFIHDEDLLEEVAGLVEWPLVLQGTFDEKFLKLPKEVLISVMRHHQRYFTFQDNKGNLANSFVIVSNIISKDGSKQIIAGNEKVIRARFEDANFFYDSDKKIKLEDRIPYLEKIIFHAKLGNVGQKVTRIINLAKFIIAWIPGVSSHDVEKAGLLAKTDLTTGLVGEFPTLQGLMGYYYAKAQNIDEKIALAIKEHYAPMGPNDYCPKNPLSVVIALSDKIDTLTGMFAIDEKPTGSKDPYALRRAALGVIRIIIENNLRLPLTMLIEKAEQGYSKDIFKDNDVNILKRLTKTRKKKQQIIEELLEFFADRLKILLKSRDIRYDVIDAVFLENNNDDIFKQVLRAENLANFIITKEGSDFVSSYKRIANIVNSEEKKDKVSYKGEIDKSFLKEEEEIKLHNLFLQIFPLIDKYIQDDKFIEATQQLTKLKPAIDDFFAKIIVNSPDYEIRENRLKLLCSLRDKLLIIANFAKIEV